MPEDFRTLRSASPEGSGRARAKWEDFHLVRALDLVEEVAIESRPYTPREELPDEIRSEILAEVIEESELLGFWLAWWQAGGFAGLEWAGWNRATIFRKLRRFRSTFGVHPDDYEPNWISLDLDRLWTDRLRQRLERSQEPE